MDEEYPINGGGDVSIDEVFENCINDFVSLIFDCQLKPQYKACRTADAVRRVADVFNRAKHNA